MSDTKSVKKVSEKNTKSEILQALDQALSIIKEKEAVTFNPSQLVEEKRENEVVAQAENISNEFSFEDQLKKVVSNTNSLYESILSSIDGATKKYKDLNEAINIQEKRLKDVFEIEKQLFNVVAIVNTQTALKEKFEEDKKLNIAKANEEIKLLEDKIKELKILVKEEEKKIADERKKNEQEYEYDLKRRKKMDLDSWNDELTKKRKEFDSIIELEDKQLLQRKEAVEKRESDATKKETYIQELEKKVEDIPTQIEAAVTKAVNESETSSKRSYNFEKMLLEKSLKGENALLQSKIESLEQKDIEKSKTIASLEEKLNIAYKEIKDMAAKSIEGSSNARYVSNLEKILTESNSNKKSDSNK